jgi:hypothetical protein
VTNGATVHEPETARSMPLLMVLWLAATGMVLVLVCANVTTCCSRVRSVGCGRSPSDWLLARAGASLHFEGSARNQQLGYPSRYTAGDWLSSHRHAASIVSDRGRFEDVSQSAESRVCATASC